MTKTIALWIVVFIAPCEAGGCGSSNYGIAVVNHTGRDLENVEIRSDSFRWHSSLLPATGRFIATKGANVGTSAVVRYEIAGVVHTRAVATPMPRRFDGCVFFELNPDSVHFDLMSVRAEDSFIMAIGHRSPPEH